MWLCLCVCYVRAVQSLSMPPQNLASHNNKQQHNFYVQYYNVTFMPNKCIATFLLDHDRQPLIEYSPCVCLYLVGVHYMARGGVQWALRSSMDAICVLVNTASTVFGVLQRQRWRAPRNPRQLRTKQQIRAQYHMNCLAQRTFSLSPRSHNELSPGDLLRLMLFLRKNQPAVLYIRQRCLRLHSSGLARGLSPFVVCVNIC